jgi:hypothetical protein
MPRRHFRIKNIPWQIGRGPAAAENLKQIKIDK